MSAKATFWAWHQRIKPASAKLVLLCLSDCHNGDNGQCNPSVPYISKMTGLDRKTVMNGIANLEKSGAIQVYKNAGSSTNYTLLTSTEIGSTENGTSTENGSTDIPTKQYQKRDGGSTENGTRTYKESKKNLNKRFVPPTPEEIHAYAESRNSPLDPDYFFDKQESCGWRLKNGQPVVNWQAVFRTWEKNHKRWAANDSAGEDHIV